MDNIWIFIVIIGAVISLAQKNQKRPKTESDNTPQPNPHEEWERQLREILGEGRPKTTTQANKPTESSAMPEYKARPVRTSRESRRVDTPSQQVLHKSQPKRTTNVNNSTTQSQYTKENKPQEAPKKQEDNNNIERIIDDFSMEKAVIYAEILKPKYEEY